MKLQNVQIGNYKCIRKPCEFDVSDITCLVGKNESGKTAILEALYRLNPLVPTDGSFNLDDDFPRIDVEDYRIDVAEGRREPAVVTRATFLLEEQDLQEIDRDFPGVLAGPLLVLSKGYSNELYAELLVDEPRAVEGLLAGTDVPAAQLKALSRCSTLAELAEALKSQGGQPGSSSLPTVLGEIQQKGLLDYLYRRYLEPRVPKFLYFDEFYQMEGHVNLQALVERRREGRLLESDHPLLGLIDLARLNLEDIDNPARALERNNRLEGASNHLTRRLMKYWSQNRHLELHFDIRPGLPGDPQGMQSGTNLWGHVYNSRQRVHTLLGRRSRGFLWYFSFLAWFSQQKKRGIPVVLLLDEPALYLHATAQKDLLRFFEDESATGHQVLYTTQSPYLVDPGHLQRVRVVEDTGAEAEDQALAAGSGTRVSTDVLAVSRESLVPVQGALGHRLLGSLLPDRYTLAVETTADLVYLQSLSSLLAGSGREALDPRWSITPLGGAANLAILAALLDGSGERRVAALLGSSFRAEGAGGDRGNSLYGNTLQKDHILFYDDLTGSSEAQVEDMFDLDFYLELVNGVYREKLSRPLSKGHLRGGSAGTAELIARALESAGQSDGLPFDRLAPARYLAANLDSLKDGISRESSERFERAFKTLNAIH